MTVTGELKVIKDSLDPAVIMRPICAGSFEVTVCNTAPNRTLKIFLKGSPDKQVGQLGAYADCTSATLGGAGGKLTLKTGDEIYVTQEIGKLNSKSDIVKVVNKSNPVYEIGNGKSCKPCNGKDLGLIFIRDELTSKKGPVFRASMCGAESASAEIRGPNNALIENIALTESVGRKGYFEGKWDWNKIGWKTSKDIPLGKYKVTFNIWSSGQPLKKDSYFQVTSQGCVELEVLCADNAFRKDCVDRINKLRKLEGLPNLVRDQSKETCSNDDAKVNFQSNDPHAQMCGQAQNTCPELVSTDKILNVCIQQQMYYQEKQNYMKNPNNCYNAPWPNTCGHYVNMTDTRYTKAACGLYRTPSGGFFSVINFFK